MRNLLIIFLTIFLIGFDQLVKWWMVKYHPSLVFQNQGIIFGFIENQAISYLLLIIGFGILIWLIYKTRLPASPTGGSLITHHLSLLLIVAGAFSNLFDRIFRGYIVDYFSFFGLNYFNLADLFIIGGVILYAYQIFRHQQRGGNSPKGL